MPFLNTFTTSSRLNTSQQVAKSSPFNKPSSLEIMLVGGGGGGGGVGQQGAAGGGGGGGVLYANSFSVSSGDVFNMSIGAGGAGHVGQNAYMGPSGFVIISVATKGSNTTLTYNGSSTYIAEGGGASDVNTAANRNGGCGAGGASSVSTQGNQLPFLGFGNRGNTTTFGGGGGAGTAGGIPRGGRQQYNPPWNGGFGFYNENFEIPSTKTSGNVSWGSYFGGGGNSSDQSVSNYESEDGSGGPTSAVVLLRSNSSIFAPRPNHGGGGGGSGSPGWYSTSGFNGASGVAMVRYPNTFSKLSNVQGNPYIYDLKGNVVYVWTGVGSFEI